MGRQEDLDRAYAELERRKRSVEIGDLTTDPVKFAEHMGFELQPWQGEIMRRALTPAKPHTAAGPGGERVLVTWEEIKALMDRKLHVGQVTPLAPCRPGVRDGLGAVRQERPAMNEYLTLAGWIVVVSLLWGAWSA